MGLRITDSSKNQSTGTGGQPGQITIGLRVINSNSTEPVKVRVTFEGNGGKWNTADNYGVDVPLFEPTPAPPEPVRSGYTFKGWATSSTATTAATLPTSTTGSAIWHAVWEKDTYTIDCTLAGGSVTGNPTTYTVDTDTITLKNPSRSGYTFKGWTGSNGTTPQTNVTIPKGSTGNKAYTANWTANKYQITFDKDNGSGGSDNVEATYDSAMQQVQVPSKKGYAFQGYYGSDGTTQYYKADGTSAKSWDKTENTTLKAHWKAKTYTVKFNFADGENGSTSVTATFDAAMPDITIPTKDGYTFAGYFDDQNTQYYDEKGKSKANWNKDADNVTLTAHWTLQITFSFPTAALIEVDASGNVSGPNLEFKSTTPEDIKVTAVKSTRSESAASLFADDTTLKGVRILLKPTTGGADSEVKVPLTVNETSEPVNWTIAAKTKLIVGFSLSLPSGAQLNYLANDGQVSIANLSYEVSAAKTSA